MPTADSQELFPHELAEIYDAEHIFLLGQEVMVQGASDEVLGGAIESEQPGKEKGLSDKAKDTRTGQ